MKKMRKRKWKECISRNWISLSLPILYHTILLHYVSLLEIQIRSLVLFFKSLVGRVPFRCPVECCCHSELVVGLNGTMGTFASRSDGRPCWLLHPVASSDMVGLHRTALESNCSHRCIPIFVRAVNSSASYIKNINEERLEGLKQQKKWWFLYLIRTEEDAQIFFEIISPYSLPPNPYHLPPHSSDAAECCDIFENSTGREFVCFYCELKFEVWFLASFGFFVLDLFIFFFGLFQGKM